MRNFNQLGPERLQGRVGGKRQIYVGPGSRFENVYQQGETATQAEFDCWRTELADFSTETFWRALRMFKGKDLVCSCRDDAHCHAAAILKLVNEREPFLGSVH